MCDTILPNMICGLHCSFCTQYSVPAALQSARAHCQVRDHALRQSSRLHAFTCERLAAAAPECGKKNLILRPTFHENGMTIRTKIHTLISCFIVWHACSTLRQLVQTDSMHQRNRHDAGQRPTGHHLGQGGARLAESDRPRALRWCVNSIPDTPRHKRLLLGVHRAADRASW